MTCSRCEARLHVTDARMGCGAVIRLYRCPMCGAMTYTIEQETEEAHARRAIEEAEKLAAMRRERE